MNRINVICLGVRDIIKARAFYRDGLGFTTPNNEEKPPVVFFSNGGTKLELFPLAELAKDINETNPPAIGTGFGGITLRWRAWVARLPNVQKRHFGEGTAAIYKTWTVIIGKLLIGTAGGLMQMIC